MRESPSTTTGPAMPERSCRRVIAGGDERTQPPTRISDSVQRQQPAARRRLQSRRQWTRDDAWSCEYICLHCARHVVSPHRKLAGTGTGFCERLEREIRRDCRMTAEAQSSRAQAWLAGGQPAGNRKESRSGLIAVATSCRVSGRDEIRTRQGLSIVVCRHVRIQIVFLTDVFEDLRAVFPSK